MTAILFALSIAVCVILAGAVGFTCLKIREVSGAITNLKWEGELEEEDEGDEGEEL